MKQVQFTHYDPKVFMIASTDIDMKGLDALMLHLGSSAFEWWTNFLQSSTGSPAEILIEVAGRLCYKSFGTELNQNITRVRDGSKEYINNVIKQRHGSVFEHATTTFAVMGASRVFTHELVRHRPNNYSQESGRFVVLDSINFYYPTAYTQMLTEAERVRIDVMLKDIAETYSALYRRATENPDMPFSEKKKITSALRRLLPNGISSDIIFTTNHRSARHEIEVRTAPGAEEEIRLVFGQIARMLQDRHPYLYQDMSHPDNLLDPNRGFTFEYSKI